MENFDEMDLPPLDLPPMVPEKRKRSHSRSFARSKAKEARYSGDNRIPRIGCTHNQSPSCSAVILIENDLTYIKEQLYVTQNKIEQDAIILSHLDIMQCKRRRARIEDEDRRRQRDLTIKYTVLKEDNTRVPVCQASFISILCVGKDRVTRIAKYWHEKGRARPENRGGSRDKKALLESSYESLNASATGSSVDSLSLHASWPKPPAIKFHKKAGSQFENQLFENREQQLKVAASHPAPTKLAKRKALAKPIQVRVAKPKPVQKPRPREKQLYVVADHQRFVMSNLAFLWKSGKLCDAGIGNGSSTVMVHKLVLYAVCPKLLSVFNMDMVSHEFLQVNFPATVSTEALNAFAEYMYDGLLDLDHNILEQLKIIARRLDMEEFEQLCDSHLPNHMHQPASAASSFTDIPLIQTTMPIPSMPMPSLLDSTISASMQSAASLNTQAIKEEISKAVMAQIQKESEEASLAPNKSGTVAGSGLVPSIKTEPVGPENDKYGQWSGSTNNHAFISTTSLSSSSSITSVPASPTEFAIPFSETANVKSTRLKTPQETNQETSQETPQETPLASCIPVSGIVETERSQSNSVNEDSSKPLSQSSDSQPSDDPQNNNDTVYPVRLFSSVGDNLPFLTTDSSDTMTVNSCITSEKT